MAALTTCVAVSEVIREIMMTDDEEDDDLLTQTIALQVVYVKKCVN